MVKDTGAAPGAGALRPLNTPRPVLVAPDAEGAPGQVLYRRAQLKVLTVEDRWRVQDEWWRERPVDRSYFTLILEEGRQMTVFQDQASKRWYQQRDG